MQTKEIKKRQEQFHMWKKTKKTEKLMQQDITEWSTVGMMIEELLKDEPPVEKLSKRDRLYTFERNGVSYEIVWSKRYSALLLYANDNGQKRWIASMENNPYALRPGIVFQLPLNEESQEKIKQMVTNLQEELQVKLDERLEQQKAKEQVELDRQKQENKRKATLLEKYL